MTALLPHNEQTLQRHRTREQQRTTPRPRVRAIEKQSAEMTVWICNVGPFPATILAGSLGPKYIPALPEAKVLIANDISVARPLSIAGLPAEPYPADEKRAQWIDHDPLDPGNQMGWGDRPGLHLALSLIGALPVPAGAPPNPQDLRGRGIFVSDIPPSPESLGKPGDPGPEASGYDQERYREDLAMYEAVTKLYADNPEWNDQWRESVAAARTAFVTWAGLKLDEANEAFAKNTFGEIRDPLYYTLAHLLKKTATDCPFLGNSADNVQRKSCIDCGSTMKAEALTCPACKSRQVSDEEYDALMATRRGEKSVRKRKES